MSDVTDAVRVIIEYLGDDPDREGLENTPARFISAIDHFFSGYRFDADLYLKKYKTKKSVCDMIIFKDISFVSHCEHHIMPMIGMISLGYIPGDYVIGIGDVVKIVDGCTRKLQIQERITFDIAKLLYENLESLGVAVIVKATHSCLMCNSNFKINTTVMLGEFEVNSDKRQEFYNLLQS